MNPRPDIKAVLADNLRHYRKKKGLSQEALAELADTGRTHIGSIEQEKANPSLDLLDRLADKLSISVGDLVSCDHPARHTLEWGRNIPHQNPDIIAPDDFAPGDFALCHWDHDQLIMTPLMVEDQELNDFLVSYLVMNGETEDLSAKAQKILEAVKVATRELTQ